MVGNNSLFGSLIYRAIGEPEYWQQNSVEALVKLLTEGYSLEGPDSLAQIKLGKELVGKLSEEETLVSAVMTVLDGARYGLLILDSDFNSLYYNEKIKKHLGRLLDKKSQTVACDLLRELITKSLLKSSVNKQTTEFTRLDMVSGGANIYLRSVPQANSGSRNPQFLHHIMVAGEGDNRNDIFEQVSKTYGLSDREIGIVQSAVKVLSEGGSTKNIAEDLFISPNTVKTHLKSIYAKSGVNSLAALVSLYLQHEVQQLSAYFGDSVSDGTISKHAGDKMMELSDGQIICYREYGDAQGRPLVVLHNPYSSRHNIPPNGDSIAKKLGRRIIIPDRPGYGKSPSNGNYPNNWIKLFNEFLAQLNLDKFDLLGNALSARYALEYADQHPEKLIKVILAAPILHASTEDKQYFGEWFSVATQLFEKCPHMAIEIYKLWHASAAIRLNSHIKKNLETTISSAEKNLMNNSDFINVLKTNFRESAAQQGEGSAVDCRYCFNKSQLDLTEIKTDIEIWAGSEDGLISLEGVRASFEALPNKIVHEKQGYGQHIYYSLFEQIIA